MIVIKQITNRITMILVYLTHLKNKTISVGHTPDSDDAFMFYAMFTDKVPSPDFTVNHVIEDIENLNLKAYKSRIRRSSIGSCMCI